MFFINGFSQEHMTFQGIPIDGNIKTFTKQMKKHGFKLVHRNNEVYSFKGRYISDGDNIMVYFSPKTTTVTMVWVSINFPLMSKTESWEYVKQQYDYVNNLVSRNYNTAEKEATEYFEPPYVEGDGNEISAILNKKIHYNTNYYLPQGRILVTITNVSEFIFSYNLSQRDHYIPNISIAIGDKRNEDLYKKETGDIQL